MSKLFFVFFNRFFEFVFLLLATWNATRRIRVRIVTINGRQNNNDPPALRWRTNIYQYMRARSKRIKMKID